MRMGVPTELLEKAARRYAADVKASKPGRDRAEPARVITIARMFGAGGISVGKRLAEALECPFWDREILDVLSSETHGQYQARMFEALDERAQGSVEGFLSSLGGQPNPHTYLFLLPRALCLISQTDAVIVGRGAHLLLPNSLKIFLKASMETRIRNIASLHSCTMQEAMADIEQRERDRAAFMQGLTRTFVRASERRGHALEYDLELNTDGFDFDAAAAIILEAVRQRFKR